MTTQLYPANPEEWQSEVRKVRYAAAALGNMYALAGSDPTATTEEQKGHAVGAAMALSAAYVLKGLEEMEQEST